jgi:hypothetical protein
LLRAHVHCLGCTWTFIDWTNKNGCLGRQPLCSVGEKIYLLSSPVLSLVCAIVQVVSPTLNLAKRRTEMFSPSLPIFVAINCDMEIV